MNNIAESELILNSRGAIYHLDCLPFEIADKIITVGDPDRVNEVSKHFDKIEFKNQHREFVTHTGYYNNQRITCISTGIGTDNIDIVLNELDALVNIDFNTRTVKEEHKSLKIIRIGTCGGLQEHMPVDSFLVSTHGLGIDNLLHYYAHQQNEEENLIIQAFAHHTQLQSHLSLPYLSAASPKLLKYFADEKFFHGITVTCPGFYAPQGRVLRLPVSMPNFIESLTDFRYGNHIISNFEMETAGIYGLGKLLKHHCLSISLIVANRVSKTFSKNASEKMEELIKLTLNRFTTI